MTSIICLIETKLTQPIEMQLSQKQKNSPEFSFAFLKSILIFKHLPKKNVPHSSWFSGNTGFQKHG